MEAARSEDFSPTCGKRERNSGKERGKRGQWSRKKERVTIERKTKRKMRVT